MAEPALSVRLEGDFERAQALRDERLPFTNRSPYLNCPRAIRGHPAQEDRGRLTSNGLPRSDQGGVEVKVQSPLEAHRIAGSGLIHGPR